MFTLLILSYCSGIIDVSALDRVHTMNMGWCTTIADVSALNCFHTLKLTNCQCIIDVNALFTYHRCERTEKCSYFDFEDVLWHYSFWDIQSYALKSIGCPKLRMGIAVTGIFDIYF